MQINSFLVKHLKLSHQQIKRDIASGYVLIDDKIAFQKQAISATNTIKYEQKIVQKAKTLFYYAYNKPVGVESTLNLNISNNLIHATGIQDYFFPIGRLDKASQGLMILTNDGGLYKKIIDRENAIEKMYEVEVDHAIDEDFIKKMAQGIEIMGVKTKPCKVVLIDTHSFQITLLEGRNRQIRRMCYKLGYEVKVLNRIAIGYLNLGDLQLGETRPISLASII
jgi:23S rRNA pseudouridine2604 synthase